MKKKILFLSLTSVFLLAACSSESEKLRSGYIDSANIALANGEKVEALKALDSANTIQPFSEENEAYYKSTYLNTLQSVFNNSLESGRAYYEEGDYKSAKEQYDIVQDVINTINFPFEGELLNEVKADIKDNETALQETEHYNKFYKTLKDILVQNDELNTTYFELIDKKRNNLVDDATFNQELAAIQNTSKSIAADLNKVDTSDFSVTYTQSYYSYYTQLVDLNDQVLESTYNVFNLTDFSTNTSIISKQKKTILDIEKSYIEFGKSNKMYINK